jgi:hypothetical protein
MAALNAAFRVLSVIRPPYAVSSGFFGLLHQPRVSDNFSMALALLPVATTMRKIGCSRIVTLALLFGWFPPTPVSASQPPSTKVNVVGSFDNLRSTAEHTYGYVVDLWREGNRVLGCLMIANGQPADFPAIAIDNGTIDDSTHRLTFQAARSGVSFRFVGTISASGVRGVLTRDDDTGRRSATSDGESIRLRSNAQGREFMHGYATYEAWKADVVTKKPALC